MPGRRGSDATVVSICLLGGFRVIKRGEPLFVRPGGRSESLLAALALGHRARGVDRHRLMTTVWPGAEAEYAGPALNTLVYSLRRSLADALEGRPPIVLHEGGYRLNAEAGVSVDVDEFDAAVARADLLLREEQRDEAARSYASAVAIYEGDLAIGSDVEHVVERERLRARYLSVRSRLADLHLLSGAIDEALANALDILAHDPCREDAHRMAMRCYVRLGQRAQALRQYAMCRDVLRNEFDIAPEAATELMLDQIRLDPTAV